MPVGQDGLSRVLEAFDQQEWGEIHLVTADVEVHLVATGRTPEGSQTSHVSRTTGAQPVPETLEPHAPVEARSPVAADQDSAASGDVVVTAPTPGIFWRAPSPGAPPFTEVGAQVEQDTQLCIVEVMKLMNTLPAPTAGTVVEICAKNGEQVDAGRPLFRIRPDRG